MGRQHTRWALGAAPLPGCGHAAPRSVATVQVHGTWTLTGTDTPICATCDEIPLSLGLGLSRDAQSYRLGAPVGPVIGTQVNAVGPTWAHPVSFAGPVVLPLIIARCGGGPPCGHTRAVWRGDVSGLRATIPARGSATLSYAWNQRDAAGHQVPPGTYVARLVLPLTLPYSMNGRQGDETITAASDHATGALEASQTFRLLG